jgi:integrase
MFENHYLETVSKHDIEIMRRDLIGLGLKESSVNKYHMIMSRLYVKVEEYRETGVVKGVDYSRIVLPRKNPCKGVKKASETPFARVVTLTPIKYQFIRQFADLETREDMDFLVFTQLRHGDAKKITIKDVDWHNYQIRLVQGKTITTRNPSGVYHKIILTPEIERLILKRSREREGALFPLTNFRKRFDKIRQQANMEWLQARDLRKLIPSWLADKGYDEDTRAKLLGHTTTRMEKIYSPRSPEHLRKAQREGVEAFSR